MTDLTDLEVEAVGVGDVRMVRTFRIGPAGQLYPVNSIDAWVDGWNTARCGRGKTHAPPGPNCRCGFYLYSDPAYALAQPPARQVMAVVATHGAMEIGSRGARASRARVEALWLGPRVSDQLTRAVRERHPTVMVFRDRTTMDQLFPLTHLDGFVKPRVPERTRRRLRPVMWTFLTAVVLLGCIPTRLTLASPVGTALWLSAVAVSLTVMLTGLVARSSVVGLQGSAALAWLITAGPQTPAIWAMRGPFVVLMATAMVIWRRAGQTDGERSEPPAWIRGSGAGGAGSQPRGDATGAPPCAAAGRERRPSDSYRATGPYAAALSPGRSAR